MIKKLSDHIHLRVDQGFAARWKKVAGKYGNPSVVHRELLTAFIEGRCSISPDPTKPRIEDMK